MASRRASTKRKPTAADTATPAAATDAAAGTATEPASE
jgi:hypothetical protein